MKGRGFWSFLMQAAAPAQYRWRRIPQLPLTTSSPGLHYPLAFSSSGSQENKLQRDGRGVGGVCSAFGIPLQSSTGPSKSSHPQTPVFQSPALRENGKTSTESHTDQGRRQQLKLNLAITWSQLLKGSFAQKATSSQYAQCTCLNQM